MVIATFKESLVTSTLGILISNNNFGVLNMAIINRELFVDYVIKVGIM